MSSFATTDSSRSSITASRRLSRRPRTSPSTARSSPRFVAEPVDARTPSLGFLQHRQDVAERRHALVAW